MFGLMGTITNAIAVIIGGALGLAFKNGISERVKDSVFKAVGLITAYIGISGSLCGEITLVAVVSMVVGTAIGEIADLDKGVNKFGNLLEKKFSKGDGNGSIAQGFVSSSLLFCVGAMTIVGSLQAGLNGDCSVLYIKSAIDFCSSIIFGATFGIGVLFSSAFVLLYQGSITLLSSLLAPVLTDAVVNEMNCVGYIVIIGLSLNIIGITKIKVMNMVPAVFLPIGLVPLYNWISTLL